MKRATTGTVERTPRAVAPVRAAFVSQLTCEAVLGIDSRRFLEVLVPRCGRHVSKVGKLRVVPLDVAERVLRAMAEEQRAANDSDDGKAERAPVVDVVPETVDGVLAKMGYERVRNACRG